MNRRAALLAIASLVAVTPSPRALAQAGRPRVILVLQGTEEVAKPYVDSFRRGLRDARLIEGTTIELSTRFAHAETRHVEAEIRAAVADKPDVLVIAGLTAARLARDATRTIPIVVATASNLVDAGVVKSFADPGGNVTGVSDLVDEAAVKRLELAKVALPHARRIGLVVNPDFPGTPKIESRVETAAPALGLTIVRLRAADRIGLHGMFDAIARSPPDALLIGGDPLFNSPDFMQRAIASRVPVIHYWQGTATQGALLSYEVDVLDNFHRAAGYVGKIVNGAKPADLPIHQPTRYRLVVNLRTAKSLGLALPAALLQRADEVIR